MKSGGGAELGALAREHKLKLSARYRKFMTSKEWKRYEGREATGVPSWSSDSRLPISFEQVPARELFVDRDVPKRLWRSWVPLAVVEGESDFFAVDAVKPDAPVSFFGEGSFQPMSPSLDAFLAGLLKRGEKTPLERAEVAVKKAQPLFGKKRYTQMLAALGTLPVELAGRKSVFGDAGVAALFNCQGLALWKLGRSREAQAALQRAVAEGSESALLTLVSLHLEEGRPARAITVGRRAALFNDDNAYWLSRYLCEAHLKKGQPDDAEKALRAIHAKHARNKERVAETRERLGELRVELPKRAALIDGLLGWFHPAEAPPPPAPAVPQAG